MPIVIIAAIVVIYGVNAGLTVLAIAAGIVGGIMLLIQMLDAVEARQDQQTLKDYKSRQSPEA